MSYHDARHRDLTNLIDRARDWDTLALLERTVGHELTPDLRVLLARKADELKARETQCRQ